MPSLFTDKKTAFMVSGPWNLDAVKKSGVKYDISAVPGFAGGPAAKPFIGVQALYVAAKGKNKTLAQEFATNYFATPAVAQACNLSSWKVTTAPVSAYRSGKCR